MPLSGPECLGWKRGGHGGDGGDEAGMRSHNPSAGLAATLERWLDVALSVALTIAIEALSWQTGPCWSDCICMVVLLDTVSLHYHAQACDRETSSSASFTITDGGGGTFFHPYVTLHVVPCTNDTCHHALKSPFVIRDSLKSKNFEANLRV